MTDKPMTEDERVVREMWERVVLSDFASSIQQRLYHVTAGDEDGELNLLIVSGETPDAAWHAAAEFTRNRQREIAEVQEEIVRVESVIKGCEIHNVPAEIVIWKRNLAARQAALEALQKGMVKL